MIVVMLLFIFRQISLHTGEKKSHFSKMLRNLVFSIPQCLICIANPSKSEMIEISFYEFAKMFKTGSIISSNFKFINFSKKTIRLHA